MRFFVFTGHSNNFEIIKGFMSCPWDRDRMEYMGMSQSTKTWWGLEKIYWKLFLIVWASGFCACSLLMSVKEFLTGDTTASKLLSIVIQAMFVVVLIFGYRSILRHRRRERGSLTIPGDCQCQKY